MGPRDAEARSPPKTSETRASLYARSSNLPQPCGSWREEREESVTSPSPAYGEQEGAIMPNGENKSGEQKIVEAEVEGFRKDLAPFVVAAETTRMAMVFTDAKAPDNPIIFANDSFLSLTGYDREEVLGQSFNSLMRASGCLGCSRRGGL